MDGFVVCKKINGWFKPKRVFLNEIKALEWGNEKEFGDGIKNCMMVLKIISMTPYRTVLTMEFLH